MKSVLSTFLNPSAMLAILVGSRTPGVPGNVTVSFGAEGPECKRIPTATDYLYAAHVLYLWQRI
jgi:hypothetical protein